MVNTTLYAKHTEKAGDLIDYNLTLEYYMITEPLCKEYSDMLRYGVKIKMISELPDGEKQEEAKEIRDIFYREKDAEDFISTLFKNKVTPTHFREVTENYISEKIRVMN